MLALKLPQVSKRGPGLSDLNISQIKIGVFLEDLVSLSHAAL